MFEKGRELYGLPQAREAIRAASRVLVVEGYMDVVMLAQHGVENAVATLGTATTPVHVQKLLRQADEVVFCFDGDAAGRRAAWHALEVSLEALADRKVVRFLFLPAEHDPDSYVRAHGREAFERELQAAQPLSAFLLATLTGRADLATLEGRSRLIADAKPLVKRVAAPALRVQLVKALAESASMAPVEAARLLEVRDGTISNWGRPGRSGRPDAGRPTAGALELTYLLAARGSSRSPNSPPSCRSNCCPVTTRSRRLLQVVHARIVGGNPLPKPVSAAFEEERFLAELQQSEAELLALGFEREHVEPEFRGDAPKAAVLI